MLFVWLLTVTAVAITSFLGKYNAQGDLVKGIEQILHAFEVSDLDKQLEKRYALVRRSSDIASDPSTAASLLSAFASYTFEAHSFTPAAQEILNWFDLSDLVQPSTWVLCTTSNKEGEAVNTIVANRYNIKHAQDYLPRPAALVRQDSSDHERVSSVSERNLDILTVVLVEKDGEYSKPERIVYVLQSIENIYDTCARMNGLDAQPLSIASCDSGSDKSFDFLGAAKVLECVKDILVQAYKAIAFRKEERATQQMKVIAESLPILDGIAEREKSGSLSSEDAMRYRHNLVESVCKLYDAGVVTPEMYEEAYSDPRKLLQPAPKLITGGPVLSLPAYDGAIDANSQPPQDQTDSDEESSKASPLDISNLTDEQREALLEQLQRGASTPSNTRKSKKH